MSTTSVILLLSCLCSGVISFNMWVDDDSLDATYLVQLGEQYDNPMLEFYGHAFTMEQYAITDEIVSRELEILEDAVFPGNETFFNYVCKVRECKAWSKWTSCQGYPGTFNMITRTRDCGFNTSLCTYPEEAERTEIQSRVCFNKIDEPGACNHQYERINGFCLRFISDSAYQIQADSGCRSEGANLLNINTPSKQLAVDRLLDEHSFHGTIYIDGVRASRYDPVHTYKYGGPPTFDNWANLEPSNGTSELCKVLEGSSPRQWYDRDCSSGYHYVCEM